MIKIVTTRDTNSKHINNDSFLWIIKRNTIRQRNKWAIIVILWLIRNDNLYSCINTKVIHYRKFMLNFTSWSKSFILRKINHHDKEFRSWISNQMSPTSSSIHDQMHFQLFQCWLRPPMCITPSTTTYSTLSNKFKHLKKFYGWSLWILKLLEFEFLIYR